MNTKNFYIVIMAGGSGTRLWPISRVNLPKQFHKFSSKRSLLQETFDRIKKLVPIENIFISVVEQIAKTSQDQLPEVSKSNFIIEPDGKNTAPAIGLASSIITLINPDAIIASLASDHTISKVDKFQKVLIDAFNFTQKNPDYLITIGIKPTEPNTGYGYIKFKRKISGQKAYEVSKFVEKPNLENAKKFLISGQYLWNASYFIFKASEMLKMFKSYEINIYNGLKKIIKITETKDNKQDIQRIYSKFPKIPFDTVIAEKHPKQVVFPANIGWSDVGSWASLYELLSKKHSNNNISQGHHIGIDDKNCLVYAQDKLLATVGLEDIIIVDTPDVTLVCNKNRSQDIKNLIEKLKSKGKNKYL
jgi:mannose-1-phosphate guanylyltransferase